MDVANVESIELGRVRKLLLALVVDQPGFKATPPPSVVVTALNDYNIGISLSAWIEDEREHVGRRFELRERVFETLRSAGVDMPTETLRVELQGQP